MMNAKDIEELFRKHYRPLLILATRLLHDEESARDIVHDAFAGLLTESPGTVTAAYLATRVRYGCLNHIRSLSARARFENLYPMEVTDVDEEWPDEETIGRLNETVDALPEQCRRVVRLRFTQRMKYVEIAHELGISEAAVYKHLHHAMNVLRQKFNAR